MREIIKDQHRTALGDPTPLSNLFGAFLGCGDSVLLRIARDCSPVSDEPRQAIYFGSHTATDRTVERWCTTLPNVP